MSSCPEDIVKQLDVLIEKIRTEIPDVPGKQRLLRMCFKERLNFEGVAKVPLPEGESVGDFHIKCSNVPHFRAIHLLAYAYRHRLLGLLWRYRMPANMNRQIISPPSVSSDSSLPSDDDVEDEEARDIPQKNTLSRKKTGYIVVDLVCLQDGRRGRSDTSHCPGNAPDADLWAPILWIKAVSRDANRLNLTWRGESLCSSTSCLSIQAKEMVSTASWYQRGQCPPNHGIAVVFHWLPSAGDADILSLDPGLLDTLTRLKVTLAVGCSPCTEISNNLGNSISPFVAVNSFKKHLAPSLKQSMFPNEELRRILLLPVAGEFREHKFTVLTSLLKYFEDKQGTEPSQQDCDAPEPSSSPFDKTGDTLEALLRRSIVYPYSSTVWSKFDCLPRVNLDTSALISMTTEIAHLLPFACHDAGQEKLYNSDDDTVMVLLSSDRRRGHLLGLPPFQCSKLDWIREAEAEKAVLPTIEKHIKDCVLMVCQTAVTSFIAIMAYVAGPSEWLRGVHLVSRLSVVADSVIDPTQNADVTLPEYSDKPSVIRRTNRRKTKHILDVGNAFSAMTMTSNSAYLRSLRQSGRRHAAILIPARALTEEARDTRARQSDLR